MKWTKEEDQKLISMWNAGETAANIADSFEKRTRNGIIGRKDRLIQMGYDLKKRQSPIKPYITKRKMKPIQHDDKPLVASYSEIEKGCCQYPYSGERIQDTIGWCGREALNGEVYCQKHYQACYQKSSWKDMYKEPWQRRDNVR